MPISLLAALETRTAPSQQTSLLLLQKWYEHILNKVPFEKNKHLELFKSSKRQSDICVTIFHIVKAASTSNRIPSRTVFTF